MKYITQKGLDEIRRSAERAYSKVQNTCRVPTITLLALLKDYDETQQSMQRTVTWDCGCTYDLDTQQLTPCASHPSRR